jgi:Na+-translocating ferredoxin:NAD+ oxidoreductase RnfD subunit
VRHFGEYGYSDGLIRATIGTVAVLVTALLLGCALRRHRSADLIAAGLTFALGIGWLAFH